eukprot:6197121-Heterocapsa_arctica.AAC.1
MSWASLPDASAEIGDVADQAPAAVDFVSRQSPTGEAAPITAEENSVAMPDIDYWRECLLGAGLSRRARMGKQRRPLLIASLCSGSLPEDLCCTALNVEHEVVAASDPKHAAFKFAQENRDMSKVSH